MSVQRFTRRFLLPALVLAALSCSTGAAEDATDATGAGEAQAVLPADASGAAARLASSPRHAEWAMVATGDDSVRSWVVYPERQDNAPVVLVVHEIFGLTPWIRAVADQLAADGFIAIAPDLLTRFNVPGSPEEPDAEFARTVIRELDPDVVQQQLLAIAEWGMALPAASRSYGIVGFCWGGSTSFNHAISSPGLGASVVYYGSSPETSRLTTVQAPVLGLYGGDDQRVNSTIAAADSALSAMGRTFEKEIYEGAGHGFLRQQGGRDDANMAATRAAWPRTISWFRQHLENR